MLDLCFGAGDLDRIRDYAAELVNLGPDAIFVVTVARGAQSLDCAASRTA
jgi:hypothetical protein